MWLLAQVGQERPPSRRSELDSSKQPAGGSCPYSCTHPSERLFALLCTSQFNRFTLYLAATTLSA